MGNSKARAIATTFFYNLIFSAPIDFKLGLIDFKLQTSILVQSICNNFAACTIAANNFQKMPKLSDLPTLNCQRANWYLVNGFQLWLHAFQKQKKANLYHIKKITLFKKVVFYQIPFWKLQRTGPQRVPPCRSLHLQLKIGISTCNKKQPFWL